MAAFDRHRVGKHEYTYDEGVKMTVPRNDGRRCLDVDEMTGLGLTLNDRGRWHDAKASERIRKHFSGASVGFVEAL